MDNLKILVVIANYGTKNDAFLHQLLDEYASMSFEVHPVVLTNVPKGLGDSVEVIVERPRGDPWSFPFAHKKILADRIMSHDLFIYSEDDTLINEQNIRAFLNADSLLADDEVAGFMRSEMSLDGTLSVSTVHGHFHWNPPSVVLRGPYLFARFTNDHSGSYILTRKQLHRAIESGGFLVGPHQGKYHLPETAATDPYTQCNLKKLVCISRIEDFVLPHLPNKYVGRLGLRDSEFFRQIKALEDVYYKRRPSASLLLQETHVANCKWAKSYYESVRRDLLELIPHACRRILSYGCGWGALEEELMKRGTDVTAVPLDAVIGAAAEARGIRVVYGSPKEALASVSQERFDAIVATNILHLCSNPQELLISFAPLLAPQGAVLATIPNLQQLPVRLRRLKGEESYRALGNFEQSGIQLASKKMIRDWFQSAGLKITRTVPLIPDRARSAAKLLGKLGHGMLASEFIVLAGKAHSGVE
jgi:2-polyprenyl-3-methyl-5-hydroxy-6-metoxy-1,4-benzoquinol methylase